MTTTRLDHRSLVNSLRRSLPIVARIGAAALSPRFASPRDSKRPARCRVTQVYDAGASHGLMCQLEFEGDGRESEIVVASIMHLTLDRKHPVARDVAAYQKFRREAPPDRRSTTADGDLANGLDGRAERCTLVP